MKNILRIFAFVLCLTACNKPQDEFTFAPDKVYFFYANSCPHCHDALDEINKKYPKLSLSMINVANNQGYELLLKCAQKFNLGNRIGTPLFCMGDKYLMGWSPEIAKQFDRDIKPFLK